MEAFYARCGTGAGRSGAVVPIILSLILAVMLASIPPAAAENERAGERVVLEGVFDEQQFLAGREIVVSANVGDDIFAAGRDLDFKGAKADHLIVAGKRLRFENIEIFDLIAAGKDIELDGLIADDMVAATLPFAGRIEIRPDAVIGGEARLAGETVIVEGAVNSGLKVVAAEVIIRGRVAGGADLIADHVRIEPGAEIEGDLVYTSENEAEIDAGAVITGTTTRKPFEERDRHAREIDVDGVRDIFDIDVGIDAGDLAILGVFGLFTGLILRAIFGFLVNALFPGVMQDSFHWINTRPLASFGIGVAVIIATPIAAFIVMLTIVGLPIALLALALYAAAYGFAIAAAGGWVGDRLRRWSGRRIDAASRWRQALWTALGMVLVGLVGAIPFIGWLAAMIVTAMAYGAIVQEGARRLNGGAGDATLGAPA